MTNTEEKLEAIKQELARQNEAWQQVMEAVARMGDDAIAVPGEVLEQLTEPPAHPAPVGTVVGGVRG